ncbi:hypothetical protein KI387_010693, partial [Taxus chinensis]
CRRRVTNNMDCKQLLSRLQVRLQTLFLPQDTFFLLLQWYFLFTTMPQQWKVLECHYC